MTASCPEVERLEVVHSLSVESDCGSSVAKEAMYCIVFFSVSTHVLQMLFFFLTVREKV